MCGIACLYNFEEKNSSEDLEIVKKISETHKHRGPDGEGIFKDNICILAHKPPICS